MRLVMLVGNDSSYTDSDRSEFSAVSGELGREAYSEYIKS